MTSTWWHNASTEQGASYYLMRGQEYLTWTGMDFTDDEERAWLGTADHLDAFCPKHPLASAPGVMAVRCGEVGARDVGGVP